MNEKKDCKIVQDLLPNYIDKLTSNETNQYIEEHINDCKDCKKILDVMQKDIQIEEKKLEKKKVKYIKKYNRRLKILKISLLSIVFILVVLFAVFPGRNMVIIASLKDKAEISNQKSDNMYTKISHYSSIASPMTFEYYCKDGIVKSIITTSGLGATTTTEYMYPDQSRVFTDGPDGKTLTIWNSIEDGYVSPIPTDLYYNSIKDLFSISMKSKIETIKLDGKECYVISNTFDTEETKIEYYVDKDTGLWLKTIQRGLVQEQSQSTYRATVIEYEYSFGTVTDEDMQEPDATEYTLIENEQ